MRTILLTLSMAGLVVAPACKKETKKPDTAQPTEPAAPSAPAEAPAGNAPGAGPAGEPGGGVTEPGAAAPKQGSEAPTMANKMAHCPSAVDGATTAVVEAKGSVVVTVTAKDKAKVSEIQKRAEHLDKVAAAPEAEIKHTGQGTGGGSFGRCPVVMAGVTLKVEKQKDGVKVTLTPKDAAKAAELARTAKERVAALKDPDMDKGGERGDEDDLGEDDEPADEE